MQLGLTKVGKGHSNALVHTGTLFNYLDSEDENTPVAKMIIRHFPTSKILRRKIEKKQKTKADFVCSIDFS